MKKDALTLILLLVFVLAFSYALSRLHVPAPSLGTSSSQALTTNMVAPALGVRTKVSNCQANGPLADRACTPGAVFATSTKDKVCVAGYSQSVRNVPTSQKQAVYAAYGIISHTTGQYEVDHLISLELGGSNDIANLWPEPANPTPGFHQKDMVENYLHRQVCNDSLTLETAQRDIAGNWLTVYSSIPR